jgi:cytochrome c553
MHRLLKLTGMISALAALSAPLPGRAADDEASKQKTVVCVPCHGANGNSTNPSVPSLAAQPALYTYYQLLMFREGQRVNPQMSAVTANLSNTDMPEIAAYYAKQTPVISAGSSDPAQVEAGQTLVQTYYCDSCHLPGLVGQKQIPRLAGQHAGYLATQMQAFKAQTRTDMDGTMTVAMQPLSAQDITILAEYIAHLNPSP